jgi:hypothetical protein
MPDILITDEYLSPKSFKSPNNSNSTKVGDLWHRSNHFIDRLLDGAWPSVLCATIVGLLALTIYLHTMAPGLTWAHHSADGGELAAAAQTLGIPHPPGYPTYILIAHLFTYLPVGEVATRTNLLSALSAALSVTLLTWTTFRFTRQWVASVGAGLILTVSPILWSQATVTEVHALNGLAVSLLLTLVVLAQTGCGSRSLSAVIGLVWGIGLGNHLIFALCAPLVVLALRRDLQSAFLGACGLVLGLAVYAYLPLRAAADPPINWGDPDSLQRFWWVVSGTPYRQFLFSLPAARVPLRLLSWTALLAQQFLWVGLIAVVLGAVALWHKERATLWATGATSILYSIFAIGYNTTDSHVYLLPAIICLSWWFGIGLAWLATELAHKTPLAARVVTFLSVLLPLGAGIYRFPTMDLSRDRSTAQFADAVLSQAPAESIIVSQRDSHTFTLWYYQHALGSRPDITLVDPALLGYTWYSQQISDQLTRASTSSSLSIGGVDELEQAAEILGRELCWIEETGVLCEE